ncbi:uncharacterized protein EAE98_002706 [Botrytis deweyae]|uniref:Enoyl reductase (ER) domain-containing protein n=1 Tax=Botrytis deweyae TaxID=2478750 RepID=A0ABQ7IUT8_9HELO|nr:uncharacterized protein EAE98_002706 [Botrytis deweyae]KAF7934661.1 hypothetical protein EAE98_002706 [Botrytis deweyae]
MSLSKTMQAIYASRPSATAQLQLTLKSLTVPTIPSGPNTALIRVHAAGINPSDVANAIFDRFGGKKPIVPGRDFAGAEVYGTSGRELSLSIDGTHAEYVAVPVEGLSIKPKCLSWTQASAVGVPYSTVYLMLEKAAARAGDVVLIFGARGAVGKAAIELANARGLKIITTSRIDGSDVNVTTDENLKSVLELNNGRGPSIILDCAGSPVLMEKGLAILGKSGRYVFVSGMRGGGPEVKINVMKMLAMDQSLHGVNSWSLTLAETKDIMDELRKMFEDGKIKGPEEESLTKIKLADAVEAYQEVAKFDGKKFVIAVEDQ